LSFAEVYLKDIPEGHYAYDAVYDLIKQGITGGFPDGTFRGKQLMTRYEIAAFISKFAASKKLARGVSEKLIEELKSEAALLEYATAEEKKATRFSGDLLAEWRRGVTPTVAGGQARYRLKTGLAKNFADRAYLDINLDTMDSGFGGASRNLVREMLDVAARLRWGTAELKVTAGPGEVVHADSGLFPAENGVIYSRPWRGIYFSADAGRTDLLLGLLSRSTDASGLVGLSEFDAKLSHSFTPIKITLRPRYFYDQSGGRDFRGEAAVEFSSSKELSAGLAVGAAKTTNYPHGLYLRGEFSLGENFLILAQRVGGEYREKYPYNILDIFSRNIADGATSVGLELFKDFDRQWYLVFRGDYTQPPAAVTGRLSLGKNVGEAASYEFVYELYGTQETAQSFGVAAKFKF